MPRLTLIASLCLFTLLFSTLPAFAAGRIADNPKLLTGKINECSDGSVEIKSTSGTIKIPVIKHSPDHLYRFGELFEAQGDDTNAEKYYRKCLAADPDHHKAKVKLGFDEETEEEKKQDEEQKEDDISKKNPDLDIDKYDEKAQQHYRTARADYRRAGKLARNKNTSRLDILDMMSKAASEYEKALKIEPGFHEARRELCIIYKVLGSRRTKIGANARKKGLKEAEKYIRSHKDNVEMIHLASWFAIKQNKVSKAESLLKKALKIKPNDPALVESLVACYLAGHRLPGSNTWTVDKKKAAKAVKLLSGALEEHTDHRALLILLGRAQLAVDKLDDAKASYEKVVAKNPNDADGYYGLGRVAHRQAKPDDALKYLAKALEIKSDHHDAIAVIILVYEGKRDYENEKLSIERYLKTFPKGQNVKPYKLRLKALNKKLKRKKK